MQHAQSGEGIKDTVRGSWAVPLTPGKRVQNSIALSRTESPKWRAMRCRNGIFLVKLCTCCYNTVFAILAAGHDAALAWDRERGTGCVAGAGPVVTPRN